MAVSALQRRNNIANAQKADYARGLVDEFRQQAQRAKSQDARQAATGRRRCSEVAAELRRATGDITPEMLEELKRQTPARPPAAPKADDKRNA
jgi:hypothetical protein